MKIMRTRTLVFSVMIASGLIVGLALHALAQVSFTLSGSYPVSPGPLVTGDFNGDGKMDLAVASYQNNSVSILLGSGTGSFGASTSFGVGIGPIALTTADFNGDGVLDLAVSNETFTSPIHPGSVSILFGAGAGSFGSATNLQVGNRPRSVAAADLNGDGIPDLAVVNNFSDSVSVLLNMGNGNFTAATSFPVGFRPISVAIGDLNGDGKPDLVVANGGDGTVSVLLGTGTGSFGMATDFPANTYPMSLSIGELNGDGKLDVAIANDGSNGVTMLPGDGTGSFAAGKTIPVEKFPLSLSLFDLNGDGKLDLVVTTVFNGGQGSNAIHILLGEGTGLFSPAITIFSVSNFALYELYPVIADLNGDGKPDIAVADSSSNNISILINNAPSADFTANPISGVPPIIVRFTDRTTGDVTTWAWDFGDGSTSTEQNPTHIYGTYGTYTVSLTVSGPGGSDTKAKVDYINVKEKRDLKSLSWIPLLLDD